MNILQKELQYGRKAFFLWTLGIAFLVVGGMVKFSGMDSSAGAGMGEVLEAFPKPVLAMFGMAEANIETFGGFYYVLQFYAMTAIGCYAVSLGTGSVLRESMDKTYEFLFTKPCGRNQILYLKVLSGWILLTAISILNGIFSWLAPGLYGIENSIRQEMLWIVLAVYLVALLYFGISVLLAVVIPKAERAVQASYGVLLIGYMLAIVFDMDETCEFLRCVTPFKYFRAGELLSGELHTGYTVVILILVTGMLVSAGYIFRKKDLYC